MITYLLGCLAGITALIFLFGFVGYYAYIIYRKAKGK